MLTQTYSHDGDLRSEALTDSSILHRFDIPKHLDAGSQFLLTSCLDLRVGGDGVIGRRVTLLQDHVAIGNGIMGCN